MPQGTGAAEPANLLHDQVGEADQQGDQVSSRIGRRSSQVATKLATRPQPSGRVSPTSRALARSRLALLSPASRLYWAARQAGARRSIAWTMRW
jgi:hypothetical protein